MRRLALTIAAVAAIFFGGASSVLAHQVSAIDVRCERHVIHVEGTNFGQELPRVVTLTGPEGYSRSFNVKTDNWSHNFPLGPNGSYSIDWPNSGDFGPVDFTVACAAPEPTPTPRPTPSAAGHTPRPNPTPPQTSSEDNEFARPMFDWSIFPIAFLILVAITGIVERYLERRTRR